ncbi:MAG: HAD family hydrolase [Solirubrobacterales bacterium]|nr:HAD family hydrolase [Solirubrobacterales bacterium]
MTRAVFIDALGTLVDLEPPWEHLRAVVPPDVTDRRLVRAVRGEMAYYKKHAHEGTDARSLAELRRRCAELISDELGVEVTAEELVAAVKMRAYPDAEPALRLLGEQELTLLVVSNWDCSLGEVLERCGLLELLDGAISSAEAGAQKPDPAAFELALRAAGCEPAEALHVGDTPEEDVQGAAAAGIRSLLIAREGAVPNGAGDATVISSLTEVVEHL